MSKRYTEYLSIDELIPADVNPKEHAEEDIKASMKRFGYTTPARIDERTGKLREGHGRMDALKALRDSGAQPPEGITDDWKMPVTRGWASKNDAEAQAELVANNQLTILGGWNDSELLASLDQLDDLDGIGFSLDDLQELANRVQQLPPTPMTDPDHIPEPPKTPITKLGDVWELGTHRVICGDSTDDGTVTKLMAGDLANVVVTDPPYGVNYTGGQDKKYRREELMNDTGDVFKGSLPLAYAHSTTDAALYLWFAERKGELAFDALRDSSYTVRSLVIWYKLKAHYGSFMSQYMPKHEPMLYCHKKGQSPKWRGPTNEVTVWEHDQPAKNEWHPTQKPVEVIARAIANSSDTGDVVLDLFGGSGSTLIAAQGLGRNARLVELDPQYVDVICQRFQEHTGIKPVLQSSGQMVDFQ